MLEAAAWLLALATVLAVASMVVRFRRARGEERQQLKWFTYAAVLSVLVWLGFIATGIADRLPVAGRGPTNAAFGPPGQGRLYVVETKLGQMEVHHVGVEGLPLHG